MKRCAWAIATLWLIAPSLNAGDVKSYREPITGWTIIAATQGKTSIEVCGNAGCNVFSIRHDGVELLKKPTTFRELAGFHYGTPILYPMPNRVRNSVFRWEKKEYEFEPNDGPHFLHGLVHSVPWEHVASDADDKGVTIRYRLTFDKGLPLFEKFAHPHTLKLDVRVTEGAVRWTYEVDNSRGKTTVPYGFGLHPWFVYQGSRAETFLTVPATDWMEAKSLIPTGKLVKLDGSPFDARKPKSLEGFVIDDVYFGMKPDQPAVIDFRGAQRKITLQATADFTHLVVYTPKEPWFCVENQTCSTDAHNLYDQGMVEAAHLLQAKPGTKQGGSVEYRITKY